LEKKAKENCKGVLNSGYDSKYSNVLRTVALFLLTQRDAGGGMRVFCNVSQNVTYKEYS